MNSINEAVEFARNLIRNGEVINGVHINHCRLSVIRDLRTRFQCGYAVASMIHGLADSHEASEEN